MEQINEIQASLYRLRVERLDKLRPLLETAETMQDLINITIVDMMNALENLYIAVNTPEDGFVSITPGRPKDGLQQE